jgi:hypothetical protein
LRSGATKKNLQTCALQRNMPNYGFYKVHILKTCVKKFHFHFVWSNIFIYSMFRVRVWDEPAAVVLLHLGKEARLASPTGKSYANFPLSLQNF